MKVIKNQIISCSCGKKVRHYIIADEEGISAYFVKSNSGHVGPAIKNCPKCHKKLD